MDNVKSAGSAGTMDKGQPMQSMKSDAKAQKKAAKPKKLLRPMKAILKATKARHNS